MDVDPIKKVTEAPKPVVAKLAHQRDSALKRFPLLFTLLGTLGVVATWDGFQRLIVKWPFIQRNPVTTLIFGIVVLLLTGTLYKKL